MEILIAPRFHLNDEKNIEDMLKHLDCEGFAVIANAANEDEVKTIRSYFWDYLEEFSNREVDRNDYKTWIAEKGWIGNKDTGIIRSSSFNHSKFCWTSRTLPKVISTFENIWFPDRTNSESKLNELIVSFDAGNAFRPWIVRTEDGNMILNKSWITQGNWWHVDQNACKGNLREGRVSVQGLMTYYDVTELSGGLCLYPKSHRLHNEICQRNNGAKFKFDYVYIDKNDPLFNEDVSINGEMTRLKPFLISAKAGDFIIWDSRTVHCNTPSLKIINRDVDQIEAAEFQSELIHNDLIRLVAYVCMVPKAHLSLITDSNDNPYGGSDLLYRRKLGFIHRVPTSHWPTEVIPYCHHSSVEIKGESASKTREVNVSENGEELVDWRNCDPTILKLVGFTDTEIQTKRTYDFPRLPVPHVERSFCVVG